MESFKMSTHGVFVLRDGRFIWGWHITSDGYNVITFYEKNKDITEFDIIFRHACEFFADSEYDDSLSLNFYHTKFNPKEDYAKQTEYTCYFDGKQWYNNWSK